MARSSSTIRSMTGFGQAAGETERFAFTVTLRAVNHRFLDLKIRLEEPYQDAEVALREIFGAQLERGRVDVTVEVRSLEPREATVEVHHRVLESIHDAVRQLAQEGLVSGELSADQLLRLPEVFRVEVAQPQWRPEDRELLLAVAERGLEQLVAARSAEGRRLARLLEQRVADLRRLGEELRHQRQEALEEMRAALAKRLEELLAGRGGAGLDPSRLEQEVAVLADRSDVLEELDRLDSHLEHCSQLLAAGGAAGKRLDFLSQEILRELNTLGAKCRNATMTRGVVDAKTLCEQLREQVQNVE